MAEKRPIGSILLPLVGLLSFKIIAYILESWFREPFAVSISFLLVALVLYFIAPNQRFTFSKWMLAILVLTIPLMSLIYGVPYLLCSKLGAVLTGGLMGAILTLFLGLAAKTFLKPTVTFIQWIIIGIIIAIYFALGAYANPSEVCGNT